MTKDRRPAEKVVHYSRKRWIEWSRHRCVRRAERYLKQQGVWTLLTEARENSKSTGADLWDYAVLHRAVLKHRPSHVLECGTGVTTWVIAHAMSAYVDGGGACRLVSMDDVKAWQQHATAIFPFERFGFVQILHADANRYSVGFVTGTVYQAVPDHPYEFVFVDGPAHQGSCNMDFIRHLRNHPELSVRAIIDRRLPTIRAYGTLLGRENVRYNPVTELGFVSPVSAADLLVNEENVVPMPVLKTGARLDWRLPL